MFERGIATLFLVIVLAITVIGGFVGLKALTTSKASSTLSPSPTADPSMTPEPTETVSPSVTPHATNLSKPKVAATAAPLVDCFGPDGKKVQLSKKDCDTFKKAWATPTPTSSPTPKPTTAPLTGCAAYDLSADIGNLTVTVRPQSDKTLLGDAGITIADKYTGCTGASPGWPYTQIAHTESSPSVTFSGMRPGPRTITTQYHGHTYTNDVQVSSGSNTLTVTVED